MRSFRHQKQSGFTLIELIIVIVIIGILAAVAIPKLTQVSDSAHQAANKAVLGMVKSAWAAAYAVTKVTPTDASLVLQTSDPTCQTGGTSGGVLCPVAWIQSDGLPGNLDISITNYADTRTIICANSADCG